MNEDGDVLETITTDVNGEAITQKYPIRDRYIYLKEKTTDQEYELNTTVYKVALEEDTIVPITIGNTPRRNYKTYF